MNFILVINTQSHNNGTQIVTNILPVVIATIANSKSLDENNTEVNGLNIIDSTESYHIVYSAIESYLKGNELTKHFKKVKIYNGHGFAW